MNVARQNHVVALLQNGSVLVAGRLHSQLARHDLYRVVSPFSFALARVLACMAANTACAGSRAHPLKM
jgi:hypothetical protein